MIVTSKEFLGPLWFNEKSIRHRIEGMPQFFPAHPHLSLASLEQLANAEGDEVHIVDSLDDIVTYRRERHAEWWEDDDGIKHVAEWFVWVPAG
jgi:hypothetical protein